MHPEISRLLAADRTSELHQQAEQVRLVRAARNHHSNGARPSTPPRTPHTTCAPERSSRCEKSVETFHAIGPLLFDVAIPAPGCTTDEEIDNGF